MDKKKKEKFVPIANPADYIQVTFKEPSEFPVFFLPVQIICQGQTDHCHTKFKFPEDFNMTHVNMSTIGLTKRK